MLEIKNVRKEYTVSGGAVVALDGVSLSVNAGGFKALQGPSGSGKTTLLSVAGGLLTPDAGEVVIDGRNLYYMKPAERDAFRARNIGFVFQQFHLVPYLDVVENVLVPAIAAGNDAGRPAAMELLERFGLSGRAAHKPGRLSAGEMQRAALARALINKPEIILADEPTGNLDGGNAAVVLEHLAEFARDGGAVLMVTHSDSAAASAHEVINISNGRV